jgi:hypothetical protein
MAISRVNFDSIGSGGDNPTAALIKLDANDADLDTRVTANAGSSSGASAAAAAAQAAAAAAQASANAALLAQTINASFRNKLINPIFDIWEFGTSFSTAVDGNFFPAADQWDIGNVGNTLLCGQVAVSPQAALPQRYVTKVTVTSVAGAGNVSYYGQAMEGARTFTGKRVVVSIEAWSSVNGKKIGLSCDQIFGTGGSPSATVNGAGKPITLALGNSRQSVFLDIPDITGKSIGTNNDDYLQLLVWLDAGSSFNTRSGSIGQASADVYIKSVQIEEVDVSNTGQPTPLEVPPLPTQYAQCRRFFRKSFPSATKPAQNAGIAGAIGLYMQASTQSCSYYALFDAPMRAAPTVTFYNPQAANGNWRDNTAGTDVAAFQDPAASTTGFGITSSSAGTVAGHRMLIHYTAKARLT